MEEQQHETRMFSRHLITLTSLICLTPFNARQAPPTSHTLKMTRFVETDLSTRIFRVTVGLNESLTTIANEPSVGLYRIQENVQGNVPRLVEERQALDTLCQKVNGCNFDLSNDREVVTSIKGIKRFQEVQNTLKKAIALRQNLIKIESEGQFSEASPTRLSVNTTPTVIKPHSHGSQRINPVPNYESIQSRDMSGIKIQPKQFT